MTALSKQLTNLSSSPKARAAVSQPDLPTISSKSNVTSVPTYSAATSKRANSANSSTRYSHAQPSGTRYSSYSASSVDKKYNIVMYGLSECPKGSPRHERISYDTDLACKAIQSICPDLREYAVCDCSRIGKYTEERSRPLMIKFARSCDAATVLANRYKISKTDHPNVFLKPYMTVAERKTESILLRERRALIESGIERKLIKIRGNSIFINKIKVGSADENTFIDQRHSTTDLQKQSEEPAPTLDITSTIATTNTTPTSDTNNPMSTFTSDTTSVLSAGNNNNDTFTRNTKSVMPVNNTNDTMSMSVNVSSNMSTNDTSQTQTQEKPQGQSKPALTNNSQ